VQPTDSTLNMYGALSDKEVCIPMLDSVKLVGRSNAAMYTDAFNTAIP
jgi:hypothetical protein